MEEEADFFSSTHEQARKCYEIVLLDAVACLFPAFAVTVATASLFLFINCGAYVHFDQIQ